MADGLHHVTAQAFVDGGYLRAISKSQKRALWNPHSLVYDGYTKRIGGRVIRLTRVTYYDAYVDKEDLTSATPDSELESYWKRVELLQNTHLAFGSLRGTRPVRQKKVDVLLAVQMLAGAQRGNFDECILVAGDADFVPVVEEIQRNGVTVTLIDINGKAADDLRRAVDLRWPLDAKFCEDPGNFLKDERGTWCYEENDTIVRSKIAPVG